MDLHPERDVELCYPVKCKSEAHGCMRGHIEAYDVDSSAKAVVELDNLLISILWRIWSGLKEVISLKWSICFTMHHCWTVSCVHSSYVETWQSIPPYTCSPEDKLIHMRLLLVPNNGNGNTYEVTAFIVVEVLLVYLTMQRATLVECRRIRALVPVWAPSPSTLTSERVS